MRKYNGIVVGNRNTSNLIREQSRNLDLVSIFGGGFGLGRGFGRVPFAWIFVHATPRFASEAPRLYVLHEQGRRTIFFAE